jgi:cobalt-zinc-cadmium efflux system membrane fusion protein
MQKWIWLVCVAVLLVACGTSDHEHEHHDGDDHEHAHDDHRDTPKGANGGRQLTGKAFDLELTIFEDETAEPQFRAFLSKQGQPVPLEGARATVTLRRFGNVTQTLQLTPAGEFLSSSEAVYEPHSYEVTVEAQAGGASETWKFESFEGRTEIGSEVAQRAGIATEQASAAEIAETIPLYGTLELPARARAEVRARFAGVIRAVRVGLGDAVKRGQTLALVEANESLTTFAVTAPIAGAVAARSANIGELSAERVLFEIIDNSQLEARLEVFPRDLNKVRVGQTVLIRIGGEGEPIASKLVSAAPRADDRSQTIELRAVVPNPSGLLRPGLSVSADVLIATARVPVAVRTESLQRWRDWDVVFRRDGDLYEAQPITLGRRDRRFAEVLAGLPPGALYVTQQSFLVKADIGKAGASHDH